MTLTRQLAEFVITAQAGALAPFERELIRLHTFDAAIARVAGGASGEGARLRAVFGGGGADAIGATAGIVRLTEMDDIHTGSNTTPTSAAAPVAFALYSSSGRDPREVENAIFVGVELLVRFGKAMDGARSFAKGFWPTRSAATLAACATACRMLGLPVDRTQDALSLAMMSSAGLSGRFVREPSGRWIVFANAVATGVRLALAAREGFNSADNVIDGAWMTSALGTAFDADDMIRELGKGIGNGIGMGSVFPELSLKPYPTARQSLAPAEAMRRLVAQGLDTTAIQAVNVRVPGAHVAMISAKMTPQARVSAFVSAAAQIATAAVSPDDLYDVERRHVLHNPVIADLAARVSIAAGPALEQDFPRIWGAEMDVQTAGGLHSITVRDAPGSPDNRLDEAALTEKARRVLSWSGQGPRAQTLSDIARSMFVSDAATMAMADVFSQA